MDSVKTMDLSWIWIQWNNSEVGSINKQTSELWRKFNANNSDFKGRHTSGVIFRKSDRSMSRSQTTGLNPTHTFFALGNLQHGTSRHVVNFTFTSNKLLKIYNMTRGCLTILRFSPQVTFSERLPSVHLAWIFSNLF